MLVNKCWHWSAVSQLLVPKSQPTLLGHACSIEMGCWPEPPEYAYLIMVHVVHAVARREVDRNVAAARRRWLWMLARLGHNVRSCCRGWAPFVEARKARRAEGPRWSSMSTSCSCLGVPSGVNRTAQSEDPCHRKRFHCRRRPGACSGAGIHLARSHFCSPCSSCAAVGGPLVLVLVESPLHATTIGRPRTCATTDHTPAPRLRFPRCGQNLDDWFARAQTSATPTRWCRTR